MKIRFLIRWAVVSAFFAACGQPGAPRADNDRVVLKDLVTHYFEGIENKDTAKMLALTTDDFVLYEDGYVWNNDSGFKNIRAHLPFTVKYRLGDFAIHVDVASADMRYSNHADFVFRDSVKRSYDWVESATFRKTPDGWRMNFLQLTERKGTRYDTLRFIKDHYQKRVALFAGEPMTRGGVVFLGNSLTEYANWKELLGDSTVVNRGIAGDNTYGVLDRLEEVISRRPDRLFLEIGVNDIAQDIPVAVIAANIATIVVRVKEGSPGTRVFVNSALPATDHVKTEYPELDQKNGQVELLDRELVRLAAAGKFGYIDLNPLLRNKKGDLDEQYAAADGLHLNKAGYAVWVRLLREGKYLVAE